MPHPRGEIRVKLDAKNGGLSGEIDLPTGTTGEFIWKGAVRNLSPGPNQISESAAQ